MFRTNVKRTVVKVPYFAAFRPDDSGCESTPQVQPVSLQTLCIDIICYNHTLISDKRIFESAVGDPQVDDYVGYELRLGQFKLPVRVSEDLFAAFAKHRLLTDQNIHIFNSRHANLSSVSLNSSSLSLQGLQVLQGHTLTELKLRIPEAMLEQVVGPWVIGKSTHESLRVLSLSNCRVSDHNGSCLTIETMTEIATTFRNLLSLSLVCVNLENDGLRALCLLLPPSVTSLDISDNPITDVSPLSNLASSLRSLTMYNLYSVRETNFDVLAYELSELLHLDISCETGHQLEAFLNEEVSPLPVELLLAAPGSLANIVSLDISGREVANAHSVRYFIKNHPKIRFLGLMLTPASYCDEFHNSIHQDYVDTLTITSLITETLTVACIKRYTDRYFYMQKALVSLFQSTRFTTEPRHCLIQLVVDVMQVHLDQMVVQMAATACLYNLTKEDLGPRIHTEYLKLMANTLLDCMARYPSNEQLQKNCLLTLCTDRILLEVQFNRCRGAQLVMDCLCKFDDEVMTRMSLAVISILASKLTTEETSVLASNHQYMVRLIEITKNKLRELSTDRTMRFALSALWNLTDESPKACQCFFKLQGLELAMDCLREYESISDTETRMSVQTKVVGLLNNVAEVKELKEHLITVPFLNLMRESLRSAHSEYSYFSGGILANLLCDPSNAGWNGLGPTSNHIQDEMLSAISEWRHPETAMVSYRCFRPFVPLLAVHTPPAVQYWALWAINHVCVKDAKKYVSMLMSDAIYPHIVRISVMDDHPSSLVWNMANNLHRFILEHLSKDEMRDASTNTLS